MNAKNGIEIMESTMSNISSTLVNTISSTITFDDTFLKQARSLLSDVIFEELSARNLLRFVNLQGSSNSTVIFEVYENERWNPLFKEWGNVVGLHLHPIVDRAPYTDVTNTYSTK